MEALRRDTQCASFDQGHGSSNMWGLWNGCCKASTRPGTSFIGDTASPCLPRGHSAGLQHSLLLPSRCWRQREPARSREWQAAQPHRPIERCPVSIALSPHLSAAVPLRCLGPAPAHGTGQRMPAWKGGREGEQATRQAVQVPHKKRMAAAGRSKKVGARV